MPTVDRFNATEGQTVRLYFRNYVNNILTDATSLSVVIRARGSSQNQATPAIVQESVGVYYVDWTVPSSNPDSLKFDPNFAGSGDFVDIWDADGVVLTQDFFVRPEDFPNNLAEIVDPILLTHTLVTPRFEAGARDYIVWRIEERDGRLVPNESLYPEGEVQIFEGDRLIKNYDNFIHSPNSPEYRYFIDVASFNAGVHKLQARFTIPQSTQNAKASVTSEKSLENGFSPSTDARLNLVVDGDNRSVSFPTTSDPARIEGSAPATLNFRAAANDVFIVEADGTAKTVRLVNTGAARTATDLVDELNGTVPAPFLGAGLDWPIVTSFKDLSATDFTILNTETIDFRVDGVDFSFQFSGFSGATTLNDVATAINTVYGIGSGTIAYDVGGILAFSDPSQVSTIEITGGTGIDILGFIVGQSDTAAHDISPATATENAGAIDITSSVSLRIQSASEGSIANVPLGFSGTGASDTASSAQPAIKTGSGANYPFSVIPLAPANLTAGSVPSFPDYSLIGQGGSPTLMGGLTLEFSELGTLSGAPAVTVTFADTTTPPAITSVNPIGVFDFIEDTQDELEIVYNGNTVVVDFTASPAVAGGTSFSLSLSATIAQINTAIASSAMAGEVLADSFQGALRIRATGTGNGSLELTRQALATDNYNRTISSLGFDGIPSSPTLFYQNDQVQDNGVGNEITAADYLAQFDLTKAILQINNAGAFAAEAVASVNGNKIKITTLDSGSVEQIEVSGGTAATILGFSAPTGVVTGTDATNSAIQVTTTTGGAETITLTQDSGKTLTEVVNEFNAQASGFQAFAVGGQLELRSTVTGSAETINVADSGGSGLITTLGLAAGAIAGQDAVDAIIAGSVVGTPTFGSGGNALLYIRAADAGFTIVDLSAETALTGVRDAINNSPIGSLGGTPQLEASIEGGTLLVIESLISGASANVEVGGLNDGSTANTTLGFSVDGAQGTGSDGQPYTLSQIVNRINAIYGGNQVAESSGNFLILRSIASGATGELQILATTTANLLNAWGLSAGTIVGTTTTNVAQTIVSPKITMVIGT